MKSLLLVAVLSLHVSSAFAGTSCASAAKKAGEAAFKSASGGEFGQCTVKAEHVNSVYIAQCSNDDNAFSFIINTVQNGNECVKTSVRKND